jgi:hypothetical protein
MRVPSGQTHGLFCQYVEQERPVPDLLEKTAGGQSWHDMPTEVSFRAASFRTLWRCVIASAGTGNPAFVLL